MLMFKTVFFPSGFFDEFEMCNNVKAFTINCMRSY